LLSTTPNGPPWTRPLTPPEPCGCRLDLARAVSDELLLECIDIAEQARAVERNRADVWWSCAIRRCAIGSASGTGTRSTPALQSEFDLPVPGDADYLPGGRRVTARPKRVFRSALHSRQPGARPGPGCCARSTASTTKPAAPACSTRAPGRLEFLRGRRARGWAPPDHRHLGRRGCRALLGIPAGSPRSPVPRCAHRGHRVPARRAPTGRRHHVFRPVGD